MSERHDPQESEISDLLERFTPRQLAIGYLRAQHRAQRAAAEAQVMHDIDGWLPGATSAQRGAGQEGSRR